MTIRVGIGGGTFERDDFAAFLDLIPDMQYGVKLRHALEPRHENFRDPAFIAGAKVRNPAAAQALIARLS